MNYSKVSGPAEPHEIIHTNNMERVTSGTESIIYSDGKKLLKWFHTPMEKIQTRLTLKKGKCTKSVIIYLFS